MAKGTKKTTGKDVANWDEELAKYATQASETEESSAGGAFFSLRGGILSFGGNPLPGNRMAVVIADSIIENSFYPEKYDPDSIQLPLCYAYGRDDPAMAPHDQAAEPQAKMCKDCEHNEWGSADTGRGKSCRNGRRLALLPAGIYDEKSGNYEFFDGFEDTQMGFLKVPVTSVKAYSNFVMQLNGALSLPPFAVYTEVMVVPDQRTQFKVVFKVLQKAPKNLIPVLIAKHKEAAGVIEFPYPQATEEEGKKGKTNKRGGGGRKSKY